MREAHHPSRVRAFLDLLLPPVCCGCGSEGSVLCLGCAAHLRRRLDEPAGAPLGLPVSLPEGIVQLEWCAAFSGAVRAAVHGLKYAGQRALAVPLAEALAARWRKAGAGGELFTWVPVHPARLRERGFDQAELLARLVAERLGSPAAALLERRQRTMAQHSLGRIARADNVREAFAMRSPAPLDIRGRWLVLVDDVVTTGASLSGCAQTLLRGGALAVSALCLAREG